MIDAIAGGKGDFMVQKSLCFQKAELERFFHCCTGAPAENNPNCFVKNEIKSVVLSNFSATGARYFIVGKILGRVKQAESGNLDAEGDDDPVHRIASQPDIWEIRWNIKDIPLRLYYAEDLGRKPEFVALSFTRKWTDGTAEEIRKRQNEDAKVAQDRFENCSVFRWGHDKGHKRCKYCFNDKTGEWL